MMMRNNGDFEVLPIGCIAGTSARGHRSSFPRRTSGQVERHSSQTDIDSVLKQWVPKPILGSRNSRSLLGSPVRHSHAEQSPDQGQWDRPLHADPPRSRGGRVPQTGITSARQHQINSYSAAPEGRHGSQAQLQAAAWEASRVNCSLDSAQQGHYDSPQSGFAPYSR